MNVSEGLEVLRNKSEELQVLRLTINEELGSVRKVVSEEIKVDRINKLEELEVLRMIINKEKEILRNDISQ